MFSVYRDIIPFFRHTQIYGLGKNTSSSSLGMAEIFLFRLVCVTTIGVCVFRCVASVAHLFILNSFMPREKTMRKHRKKINQQIEDTEDDDFFVFESEEVRKRFIQKLWESVEPELPDDEEIENMERPPATKRHKIRMNRLFRERIGSSFLPFPEADNFYQRARSKIIVKLRINKLMYRWQAYRRKRQIIKYEKRHGMW